MSRTLEIYISEHYSNYNIVDSLVLDIDTHDENKLIYYAEQLTNYFRMYYDVKHQDNDQIYILSSEELKLIMNSDCYYLGSSEGVLLYPNRVKFVTKELRIKYFTDICD